MYVSYSIPYDFSFSSPFHAIFITIFMGFFYIETEWNFKTGERSFSSSDSKET